MQNGRGDKNGRPDIRPQKKKSFGRRSARSPIGRRTYARRREKEKASPHTNSATKNARLKRQAFFSEDGPRRVLRA